ncbi:uncharacterized protein LOC115742971 [Rhodamnia argentea]|uniref:Uncharacterized protein LOC115742971 n=1 Tax=Rhodamnia argentea TaxID=178133 RepID=A0A8B8PFE4_9MYRT|nr:uncharacterized protein LOC115742971 [Rhodamnia argentea]
MGCKINASTSPILRKLPAIRARVAPKSISFFSSSYARNDGELTSTATTTQFHLSRPNAYKVDFKTLGACKLGISRYPDFEYNAHGGTGSGHGSVASNGNPTGEISVSFDPDTLSIPPLTSVTTKFLGLPLPPFLRIDIVPQLFEGRICQESGKVHLQFKAKFCFSVGSLYRAPPLIVETVLTSEESNGTVRGGRGERLDEEGNCRLVGVASVDPIDDLLMNSFLGLPAECIASLNAVISLSSSSSSSS